MVQGSTVYPEEVEQVRRRFADWRGTHAVRSRLPEELWAAAAELAQRDGIGATARVLGVDQPSLRKWTGRLRPNASGKGRKLQSQRKASTAPAFMELLAETTGATTSCLLEVESPRGGKLRLDLKAIAPSQLAELIRAFVAS